MSSGGATETRERILDAATRLFTNNGYSGTSVRMITREAEVPVALVNYHFGSKQGLMEAVFARALGDQGENRVKHLEKLEKESKGRPLPVKVLVEAFLTSALRLTQRDDLSGTVFKQLVARAFYEPGPGTESFFPEEYAETIERYKRAFRQTLPGLSEEEIIWRMYFMVGIVAYVIAGKDTMRITHLYGLNEELSGNPGAVLQKLVPFLVAGFSSGGSGSIA
jgi:AcrR family transcriptional regulator